MKKQLSVIAVTLGLVACVQAVQITGTVDMSGTATLDNASLGSANGATAFSAVTVGGTPDGAYTGSGGSSVTWSPFAWTPASTPAGDLWTFGFGGRTYAFHLATVSVVSQNNFFLNLTGAGTLTISGVGPTYDPTPGTWSFTISNSSGGPHANFNFTFANSQTAAGVPDGGMTVALLGFGLTGLALARRKFFGA